MKIYFKDVYRFFSKISVKKLINAAKLLVSFYISKWTRSPYQAGLPMTISIEPTTACNLRCPECPSGLRSFTRDTGNLKRPLFSKILSELSSTLIYLIFYFQGEPYINPDFLDMVKEAHKKNIYTITSTNGHFLNDENAKKTIESGLDRLIISVDGTTQEVYQQYRKEGHLDHVLQGAKNIVKWKKELNSTTPHTIFQFLIVKPNEHQIEDVKRLAKEIGIDEVKFKSAQLYDYKNGNDLMPSNEKLSRYKKLKDGTYTIKNYLKDHCWKLWHAAVITWDGNVIPCCFDKDAKYAMGSLSTSSFKNIFKNNKYKNFRQNLLKGRQHIDICSNCTEGCKVWLSE